MVVPHQVDAVSQRFCVGIQIKRDETDDLEGLTDRVDRLQVVATRNSGKARQFRVRLRIDTPKEWEYYRHGGILHYVIRHLAAA